MCGVFLRSLLLVSLVCPKLFAGTEIRAAMYLSLDKGELQIAAVDTNLNLKKSISNDSAQAKSYQIEISAQTDLSKGDGENLSFEYREAICHWIGKMLRLAKELGAKQFFAVAAEPFGKVKNFNLVIDSVLDTEGVQIEILNANQEAALRLVAGSLSSKINRSELFIIDVGAEKTILAADDPNLMKIRTAVVGLGSANFFRWNMDACANQISALQVEKSLTQVSKKFLQVDEFFREHVVQKDTRILGVGEFFNRGRGLKSSDGFVSKSQVHSLINSETSRETNATQFSNLILLAGIMDTLKIEKIEIVQLNLTEALLLEPGNILHP